MNLDDDLLLVESTQERAEIQFALYAVHLSFGTGLFCQSLKLDTIKQYIFAVASFIALFSLQDFRRVTPLDRTFGPHLTAVCKSAVRPLPDVVNRICPPCSLSLSNMEPRPMPTAPTA